MSYFLVTIRNYYNDNNNLQIHFSIVYHGVIILFFLERMLEKFNSRKSYPNFGFFFLFYNPPAILIRFFLLISTKKYLSIFIFGQFLIPPQPMFHENKKK